MRKYLLLLAILISGIFPAMANDEVIPTNLNLVYSSIEFTPSIPDNAIPDSIGKVTFVFNMEAIPTEDACVQLCDLENGAIIKEAPAKLNDEVNCFHIEADFGNVKLTSGHKYSVVLPEGTILRSTSDGICTNPRQEYVLGPQILFSYEYCDINYKLDNGYIPENLECVWFIYAQPYITVDESMRMQLYDMQDNSLIAEVPMRINHDVNHAGFVVEGLFDNLPLEQDKKYQIVVPEGAIRNPLYGPSINERVEYVIGGMSGISDVNSKVPSSDAVYDLNGNSVSHPEDGKIYIIGNRKAIFKN